MGLGNLLAKQRVLTASMLSVWFGAHAMSAHAQDLSGFDCLIEPNALVRVSTREDGILELVEVGRGELVTKGQVLARLESGVENIAVELARARSDARYWRLAAYRGGVSSPPGEAGQGAF